MRVAVAVCVAVGWVLAFRLRSAAFARGPPVRYQYQYAKVNERRCQTVWGVVVDRRGTDGANGLGSGPWGLRAMRGIGEYGFVLVHMRVRRSRWCEQVPTPSAAQQAGRGQLIAGTHPCALRPAPTRHRNHIGATHFAAKKSLRVPCVVVPGHMPVLRLRARLASAEGHGDEDLSREAMTHKMSSQLMLPAARTRTCLHHTSAACP